MNPFILYEQAEGRLNRKSPKTTTINVLDKVKADEIISNLKEYKTLVIDSVTTHALLKEKEEIKK